MTSWWDDIRFSFRTLARNRSLTIIASLTLALGIGANTAIFSTVAAYFWAPLPYGDAERVVYIAGMNRDMGWSNTRVSYLDGSDWRAAGSLDSLTLYRMSPLALSGAGEPQNIVSVSATPELFETLKVAAARGRTFDQAERGPGEHRVAVITDGLWIRQFGADPNALGRDIRLDGNNYTIIGVMPPEFHFFYSKADIFIPLYLTPDRMTQRDARFLRVIGRLKPGATMQQAMAEVAGISDRLAREFPKTNRGWTGDVRPAIEVVINRGARVSISTMYYAVTFVLLIACVNIASLLLSRGAIRQKELAIRAALGAGRANMVRLLLTESMVLGLIGGVLGAALAYWAMPGLRRIAPQDLARPELLVVDTRALLYAFAICIASGLLAGLVPALAMTRGELAGALHGAGRGNTGARHRTLRSLVVVEVVLSVVLLAGSGLIVKNMVAQLSADPGFNKTSLVTAAISLPKVLYSQPHQPPQFFRQVLDEIQTQPGVVSAAAAQEIPLGGSGSWYPVIAEGVKLSDARDQEMVAQTVITPGYFETMQIPLLAGRTFTVADSADAPGVAIVNQTLASRYWPKDPNPVGRRIKLGSSDSRWLQVVGVCRDVRQRFANVAARPDVYTPNAQAPVNAMVLIVRAKGDPRQAGQVIRSAVSAVDPNQPISTIETLDEWINRNTAGPRATAQVMGFLAVLALVLAAVGMYGVIGYMASQRSRELGIRLALGAVPGGVFAMVLRSGVILASIGLVLGLGAAAALTPMLRSIVVIDPHDLPTFAVSGIVLMVTAVAATVVPALRAMRLDPIQVLREE